MKITIDKANVNIKDGKITIDLNSEDTKKLIESMNLDNKVQVHSIHVGDTFTIGDEEFIVLDNEYRTSDCNEIIYAEADGEKVTQFVKRNQGVAIIRKDFLEDCIFGDDSNWFNSKIRAKLNCDYFKKIAKIIGENNILKFNRDLTSLDGLDDYGTCVDKISLLSADEYRKYHKILGLKSNYPNWWWTITPASTPSNDYSRSVCCVGSSGVLSWRDCVYCRGVRPFLILEPSTLVTCNK